MFQLALSSHLQKKGIAKPAGDKGLDLTNKKTGREKKGGCCS
jgi:hypothetical protein